MARTTESVLQALGLRIQEVRRAAGMTQQELAGIIEMHTETYARIEQGRANPTVRTLVRIANGLEVSPAVFWEAPSLKRSRPGRPSKAKG